MAREVGTEGQLGGQARVEGVVGHVARPDRQRELHGRQPDLPGAQHRPGRDRGRQRRPRPEDHRRRAGRDPRAQADDQRHGRPAVLVRRRGHARGARGRHRGQARRSGPRRGRLGHVARPHRERQPAGRQPDHPGARDRRGVHRGDPGRPDALDHRRGRGRGRRAQGQHQPDDREPPRDHEGQRGAGLAEDQPRPDLGHAPGPARPAGRDPADHERGHPGRQRPARRVLPRRARRLGRATPSCALVASYGYKPQEGPPGPLRARRGARRPGGGRGQADPPRPTSPPTTSRSPRRLGEADAGDDPGHADHVRGAGPRRDRARRRCGRSARSTRRSSTSSPTRSASSSTRSRRTCARRSCCRSRRR